MRRFVMIALLALILPLSAAQAAGPFDGNWSGEVAGTTGPIRSCIGPMKGTVADNVLHGQMTIGKFKPIEIIGTVAPDGTFNSTGGKITGKFEGNNFVGSFSVPNGYCNPYKLTMSR
jgi:hypothetical protein